MPRSAHDGPEEQERAEHEAKAAPERVRVS